MYLKIQISSYIQVQTSIETRYVGSLLFLLTENKADGHGAASSDRLQEPKHQEHSIVCADAGADPSHHLEQAGKHQWYLASEPAATIT